MALIRGTNKKNNLHGTSGNDVMFGLGGNDVLLGRNGNDVMHGGKGNELLDGGNGNDKLFGDQGDDLLIGGKGADQLNGGAGIDTASYLTSTAGVTINILGSPGSGGDAQGDRISNVEIFIGSNHNDVLGGGVTDSTISEWPATIFCSAVQATILLMAVTVMTR